MAEIRSELPELNEEEKKDLLKVLIRKALEERKKTDDDAPAKLELLKKSFEIYSQDSNFNIGDIVKWKTQMKNRKVPDYDEPVIIIEKLEAPIINLTDEIGSAYYNEKYDIKIGIMRDNTFLTYHFESKRFTLLE